jgi:hypothetical protein
MTSGASASLVSVAVSAKDKLAWRRIALGRPGHRLGVIDRDDVLACNMFRRRGGLIFVGGNLSPSLWRDNRLAAWVAAAVYRAAGRIAAAIGRAAANMRGQWARG